MDVVGSALSSVGQFIYELWTKGSEPQAIITSSIITVFAAIAGVFFGWLLFRGRVKSLTDAVEHTEKLLHSHKENTTATLGEIVQQVASSLEAINTLRGQLADQVATQTASDPATAEEPQDTNIVAPAVPDDGGEGSVPADWRTRLAQDWDLVRAEIERLAADPTIDGRTRAKYSRIDRRSYGDLIDALARDGVLQANAQLFREAHSIWMKYRNGRRELEQADLPRLTEIRGMITHPE